MKGRSPAYIGQLLARSVLPSNEHPKDMEMLEFPFAADEGLVRSTLEATALSGFSAKHPSKR
jgi:hypothetical protein